jgi:hypothetical protein
MIGETGQGRGQRSAKPGQSVVWMQVSSSSSIRARLTGWVVKTFAPLR